MSSQERRTVLVVDDSPVDVAVLSEIMKQEYTVLGATNAASALEILHSSKVPDLILLDILMPGLDGLGFCRQIRADPVTRRIPVIFVTSKDTDEDEAAGFAAGGVDYVAKPVNPHLLRARVKTHLELKLAREDLEAQNEILKENARLREEVEQVCRHDLKNPLMVIMNIPPLLLHRPGIGAEEVKWLQMIQNAARRMLEVINISIDMFKMEKGIYDLHPAPVNALAVARQISDAMAEIVSSSSLSFGFMVEGQPAETAGAFMVSAEEPLLYCLLLNLIRNAVEASPAGARVSLSFSTGAFGVIAIHNAGAIPASIRGRFFQKFATAGKPAGTGLGAYSAQLIARTLGGTIDFQSSEQAGTTITVSLPRAGGE